MGKLTVAKVKAITTPGRYSDGGTLFLFVKPGGSRSWVQRLTIDGTRRDMGLGGWPLVSLAEARIKAFENRKLARIDGGDPLARKRKAKLPTFLEAAEHTFKGLKPKWRNAKHAQDWWTSVERYAFPIIGTTPVDRVRREDVLRILTPIWSSRPERARRLRQRIRAVLAWAQAHNYIPGENVAGEAISGALPKMAIGKTHFRALPHQEVAAALETVEASGASLAAKHCLRFLVLTAARSGEARESTWSEVDLEKREWRIPAVRMKAGAEHRVPLSDSAVEVLEQAQALDDGSGLVFPSALKPGRCLSDMTLTKLLRDTGLAGRATVHGMRSSFRDWAAETGQPREIAEAALAHTVGGVEGAYFRSDLFAKRRRLMNQWAAYLTGRRGEVVKLHG
jgi:integrase